jgi:outer membrane cobalamin receptor
LDHTPIVVTGSRVASALDSPTPTISIGADALERRQAVSAADLLSIVPSLKATTAPSASGTRNNLVGVSQADLRGLGPDRTLVLVDGMRIVPQVPSVVTGGIFIAPDLNTIPALMINRAEVVTGGASAQYGSDAVAGVVNILLKKRHEGTKLTMQSGISQYGDAFRFRVGGVTGLTAVDGRVNLVASAEYSHSDGVGNMYSRPWGRMEYQRYDNNGWATNGLPRTLIVPHVRGYTSPA